FSSRRRHTRSKRDWSSDVCSSDLQFQDLTDLDWRRFFAVNLDGAFYAIQAVLPHMLHKKRGAIVNVSSIWGLRGASCEVAYSARSEERRVGYECRDRSWRRNWSKE